MDFLGQRSRSTKRETRRGAVYSIAALESLRLTKREAEVLFWVAKDKSNVEITKVLDCCEGPVRKHLEHLYKKLEVQTRIGAVITTLERLGLL
jgi:DNA-binding CsgD family transcriptional regulator